jgi:hypothetical protein
MQSSQRCWPVTFVMPPFGSRSSTRSSIKLEADDGVLEDPRQLVSLTRPNAPGRSGLRLDGTRPRTPLSDAALLTDSHGEATLGAELRAELVTAARFVRHAGDRPSAITWELDPDGG